MKQLTELGGELNKVKLNEVEPGNNEMIATEDIATGDLIAFIPDQMVLTFADAKIQSTASNLFEEKKIYDLLPAKERDFIPMVLYIVEQRKNSDSVWKDYLGVLPKDMSEHPVFYTEEELDMFKGDELGGYVRQ